MATRTVSGAGMIGGPGGALARAGHDAHELVATAERAPGWIPVYNTKEIVVTRASVKGFTVHPVAYNLGLWKTWLDK